MVHHRGGHRRDLRRVPVGITTKETPETLTDHDLPELLAALQAGEVTDRIRQSPEWILQ
jgi:hypothetical protein